MEKNIINMSNIYLTTYSEHIIFFYYNIGEDYIETSKPDTVGFDKSSMLLSRVRFFFKSSLGIQSGPTGLLQKFKRQSNEGVAKEEVAA